MNRSIVKIIILALLTTLSCSSCFWYRVDYNKLDPRCKDWVKTWHKEYRISENVANNPSDAYTRYEYYICINTATGSMSLLDDAFIDIPSTFVHVVKQQATTSRTSWELWMAVYALQILQERKAYDVANDNDLISTIRGRISTYKDDTGALKAEEYLNSITNTAK